MLISVCVCTYNRAQMLSGCLQSLMELRTSSHFDVEIIVIDNNSSDNTKDVVLRHAMDGKIRLLYFHEATQGLSAARNRAVQEARGDYLAFLDDECIVQANWIEIVVATIEEFQPLIIGGPYTGAIPPGNVPAWFKSEYGNAYFVAHNFSRGFQQLFRASGGNIFLHRKVFEAHHFDERFGVKGNELKLGEEIVLQNRFLSANPNTMVFYEPQMEVAHFILPHKMRLSYFSKRMIEAGASGYAAGHVRLLPSVARACAALVLAPFRTAFRNRKVYPFWQNYVYEKVIPIAMPPIGAAMELIQRRYR